MTSSSLALASDAANGLLLGIGGALVCTEHRVDQDAVVCDRQIDSGRTLLEFQNQYLVFGLLGILKLVKRFGSFCGSTPENVRCESDDRRDGVNERLDDNVPLQENNHLFVGIVAADLLDELDNSRDLGAN